MNKVIDLSQARSAIAAAPANARVVLVTTSWLEQAIREIADGRAKTQRA